MRCVARDGGLRLKKNLGPYGPQGGRVGHERRLPFGEPRGKALSVKEKPMRLALSVIAVLVCAAALTLTGCSRPPEPTNDNSGRAWGESSQGSSEEHSKAGGGDHAAEQERRQAEARPAARNEPPRAERPGAIPAPADVAAPPADAERTPSGLASKVLSRGTGTRHPAATNVVRVHYTGWTTDGRMFDSSVARGEPTEFPLNRVIAGWTEGLQLMVEGEKRRFWIPQDLAYRGQPGPPAGMLVFDVELLQIQN